MNQMPKPDAGFDGQNGQPVQDDHVEMQAV